MAIVATYTYRDIVDHIESVWGREYLMPTPKFVLQLCNQALREIAAEAPVLKKTWTGSATAGDSSLVATASGGKIFYYELPFDLINIIRVDYDAGGSVLSPLDMIEHGDLDLMNPGWQGAQSSTGVPTRCCVDGGRLELNVPLPEGSESKISMQGYCHLPAMTPTETVATTPLRYIPATQQLAFAWYVVSEMPIRVDNKAAVVMQARYQQKWVEARRKIMEHLGGLNAQWANGL